MNRRIGSLLFALSTLIGVIASAQPAWSAPSRLPVTSYSDFVVGREWTWDYWDGSEIYSTERYTVLQNDGKTVTIEMSTQLAGEAGFTPHHRTVVNVAECLRAYADAKVDKPWSFTMYYRDGGKWTPIRLTNTLSFEEKFNCNPHVHTNGRRYTTVVRASTDGDVFQQRKVGRGDDSTWFFLMGARAATAFEKQFVKSQGQSYWMRLRP